MSLVELVHDEAMKLDVAAALGEILKKRSKTARRLWDDVRREMVSRCSRRLRPMTIESAQELVCFMQRVEYLVRFGTRSLFNFHMYPRMNFSEDADRSVVITYSVHVKEIHGIEKADGFTDFLFSYHFDHCLTEVHDALTYVHVQGSGRKGQPHSCCFIIDDFLGHTHGLHVFARKLYGLKQSLASAKAEGGGAAETVYKQIVSHFLSWNEGVNSRHLTNFERLVLESMQ
jgi:hypothetical protein